LDSIKAKHAQGLTEAFEKKPNDIKGQLDLLDKFAMSLRLAMGGPGTTKDADTDHRTRQLLADIQKDPLLALKTIATGLAPLDRELGMGMSPGQIIVLSALVNLGKTYLLCRIAENIRKTGKRVLFVPLEMTSDDIKERCLALRFKLNVDWYIKKEKPPAEKRTREGWYQSLLEDRLKKEKADVCQGKVFVEEPIGPCNANVIRTWIRQYGVDVVLIDAAQDLWDNKKTSQKVERLYNAVEEIKMLAAEMKVPFFLTVQLTGAVEKQGITKGNINNISWSQAFAQKAHAVFTMLGDRSTGIRDVTTDKNRDGGVGRKWEVTMKFPEVEIEARDLQPVGFTINPADIFEDPVEVAKLFENPVEEKKAPKEPPKRSPPPRAVPQVKQAAPTSFNEDSETPYREKRDMMRQRRDKQKDKRNAIIWKRGA
jgi:hypothetical protein